MNYVVAIPTIDPDERLAAMVRGLRACGFDRILVVDDGSALACRPVFEEVACLGATIAHHASNRGKGAAIKTALAKVRGLYPDAAGVVFCDDDGQHRPEDVLKVCECAMRYPESVVIGQRDLSGVAVPWRSKVGNAFSSWHFRLDTGMACADTQTGLRCIPAQQIPLALSIEGNRYDFEMEFLTQAAKRGIAIEMEPIQTIYHGDGQTSHFRTVRDSLLIYRNLALFAASSLACSVIDLGVFALLAGSGLIGSIVLATVVARACSGGVNFAINRVRVFGSDGPLKGEAMRYAALFLAQMSASAILVAALSWAPLPLVGVKALVDCALFFASYFVQRNWVFKERRRHKSRPGTSQRLLKGAVDGPR